MNLASINWNEIYSSINDRGFAQAIGILSPTECRNLTNLYNDPNLYRTVISMQRYRFGKGEYKYFNYPLPPAIQILRQEFYQRLANLANEWSENLSLGISFPSTHPEFLVRCREKNQVRPTPLILRYESGGHNTLHQDLYGEVYFPFQVVFLLSQYGRDFQGGEFVLTEQVPRAQSRAQLVQPNEGDALKCMLFHHRLTATELRSHIRAGRISLAGNKNLKIFGTLNCASGKRMKRENRVFFQDISQAVNAGYRPCGHCMKLSRSSPPHLLERRVKGR